MMWAGLTIPLDHYSFRIRTILAVGLAAAAPTVVTLWLIGERLRRLHPLLAEGPPISNAGDRVEELRTLGRWSVRSLAAASMTVSLAVVVTGAFRNALLAYDHDTWEEAFPASSLLLYGAFFTVAFAAVYMPTLLTWRTEHANSSTPSTRHPMTASQTRRGRSAAPRWSSSSALTSASWPSSRACSPSSVHLRRASSLGSFPSSPMGSRPRAGGGPQFTPSLWHLRSRMTWGNAG
jgi:hypothetical protein